jgi:hypothetical protein
VLRVKVQNLDRAADRDTLGHAIQLVAEDGSCPPGTVGMPDFDRRAAGAQDTALVRGGARKTARVSLVVHRDAFASPDRRTPDVCSVRLTAVGPTVDPTPEDNVVEVEVHVLDRNDS